MTVAERRIAVCWSPRDREVHVMDWDDKEVLFGIKPGEALEEFIQMMRHAASMAQESN